MDLAITYDDEAEVKKLYVNGELAVESNDAVAEKIPIMGRIQQNRRKPSVGFVSSTRIFSEDAWVLLEK